MLEMRLNYDRKATYDAIVGLAPVLLLEVLGQQVHGQLSSPRGPSNQGPGIWLIWRVLGLSSGSLAFALGVTLRRIPSG